MKNIFFFCLLITPVLAVAGPSNTINNLSITGTLTFGQSSVSGTIPAANIAKPFVPTSSVSGLNVGSVASDPSTLVDGDMWFNSTSHAFKVRANGTTSPLVNASGLSAAVDAAFGSSQGDILYRDSSAWMALTPGTSGQFLETLGASANPIWATPSGGGNVVTSGTITSGQTTEWNSSTSAISVANVGTGSYVKADYPTFVPTSSLASLNVGALAGNPSGLTNGDLWYNSTSNSLNARINGATVALGGTTPGTPTVAVGGAAGSGASASITGTDTGFVVTLNTGTGSTFGTDFTVTFGTSSSSAPQAAFSNTNINATQSQYFFGAEVSTTTTTLTFTSVATGGGAVAPSSSATFIWSFITNAK
jgi:hypothetical protein